MATITIPGMFLTGDHASRPAADAVGGGALYSCTDHSLIYQSDGSAWSTWATLGAPAASVIYDIEKRTAGNLSITSTTAGAAVPTLGTLSVAAVSGDLLMVGLNVYLPSDTELMRLDVATIVSAAAVNYLSSGSGTPASVGVPGWRPTNGVEAPRGGSIPYVVQAGDISGGNVELGLRAWLSGAGSRDIAADAGSPLTFWVQNFGQ